MLDLLLPETIASHGIDLETLNTYSAPVHIVFEEYGPNTLVVRSVPSYLQGIPLSIFLQDLLEGCLEEKNHPSVKEKQLAKIARQMTRSTYRQYTKEEIRNCLDVLGVLDNPYVAPNGEKILVRWNEKRIQQEFK